MQRKAENWVKGTIPLATNRYLSQHTETFFQPCLKRTFGTISSATTSKLTLLSPVSHGRQGKRCGMGEDADKYDINFLCFFYCYPNSCFGYEQHVKSTKPSPHFSIPPNATLSQHTVSCLHVLTDIILCLIWCVYKVHDSNMNDCVLLI